MVECALEALKKIIVQNKFKRKGEEVMNYEKPTMDLILSQCDDMIHTSNLENGGTGDGGWLE